MSFFATVAGEVEQLLLLLPCEHQMPDGDEPDAAAGGT
jgi:hypothetical protein